MSRNVKVAHVWLVAALLLWALPGVAQDVPVEPVTPEVLPRLAEVMAQFQDTGVYLEGYIGRGPEGNVRFLLPEVTDNGFPVEFQSDADLDKAIEGCGFDGSGGLPCLMTGSGFLNWEQSRLQVVLTRIDTIAPPTLRE